MKHLKIVNKAFSVAVLIGFGALSTSVLADQVILDDLIVDGSLCAGFDCVNGESFGFDTIRIKENNMRLHFDDTSATASFPKNDWRLIANDSSNGGASYLAIEDSTAGRVPFRVDAGAPSNSLRVESTGDVGIGIANPVIELHMADGDSTGIRLEQNGTAGWTPQTWDIAGNETNFFIRDATNGSSLPFKIRPNTSSDTLTLSPTGVGIGIGTATSTLHVRKSDASLKIENNNAAVANRQLVEMVNNGGIGMRMDNTDAASVWDFSNTNSGNFTASKVGTGGFEFEVQGNGRTKVRSFGTLIMDMRSSGNLYLPVGDVFVGGTKLNVPDYVFDDDYKLMSLEELKSFVNKNKHLPNVASEAEIKKAKHISIAKSQMRHLEKIEELTLYTIQQHEQISSLQEKNEQTNALNKKLDERTIELNKKLNEQEVRFQERLASLEKLVTNLAMGSGQLGKGAKVAIK